ncbi:MAG TPA: hypothetical protein VGP79_11640 [Bryobacteraceae bacterium]|nr:hypothetical protein [Bryobacteraceae bacterium]
MRAQRERKKKLIVAFHFHTASQAGWKCDVCRKQGLEAKRRCGFIREEKRGPRRAVWVRGRVAIEECPKSAVTAASVEWLERFFAWRFAGGGDVTGLAARDADAILTLEAEWRSMSGKRNNESI